jgi:membrane fusion protein (multidrug efflux system)
VTTADDGATTELPGRVEASRVAQVRARVTGIVQKRMFREGSDVKAGQVLFAIDPAPYQATVDSAKAALAKAQANTLQATAQATRFKPLHEANAISQQDYINAQAAQAQAEADVAAAGAALRTAQLNLGYASVTAPISGRIGRALVTEGALVSQAERHAARADPADRSGVRQFHASRGRRGTAARSRRGGRHGGSRCSRRACRARRRQRAAAARPAAVFRPVGRPHDRPGDAAGEVLNPADASAAGHVRAHAAVQGQIAAQSCCRSRLTRGPLAIRCRHRRGRMPAPRAVRIGGAAGSQWIVLDGLKPGEQVIVEGSRRWARARR